MESNIEIVTDYGTYLYHAFLLTLCVGGLLFVWKNDAYSRAWMEYSL